MSTIEKIMKARAPLTLAGVPAGFEPVLLADLARGAGGVVFVAADDLMMQAIADTAHYFAPELEIIRVPSWDCLPYDRASPSLRAASERLARLPALPTKPSGARPVPLATPL